jgi:spore germination protein
VLVVTVLVGMVGAGVTSYLRGRGGTAAAPLQNVAVIPYWNLVPGTDSAIANRAALSVVSPWMFGVSDDGHVVPLAPDQADQQAVALQRLRNAGLKIIPTIANYRDGQWRYPPIARILHSPDLMNRQVSQIVALAASKGWAGVDIDYEELRADDRAAFTDFVRSLAAALHAVDLTLSVDVFAKTTDSGYDQRDQAQDYAALGGAADQIRVMAYDYHWSTSAPGPIAPFDWVRDALDYTLAHIPAQKVLLGVPLYGYDWAGGAAQPVSWAQVYDLARTHAGQVRWDQASQSPWLQYTDGSGVRHVVWFENAYSSSTKFALARGRGVHGVALWMYGSEDQVTWSKLLPAATAVCPVPGGGG